MYQQGGLLMHSRVKTNMRPRGGLRRIVMTAGAENRLFKPPIIYKC